MYLKQLSVCYIVLYTCVLPPAGVDFEILTNHELTFVATGMQVMPIEIYNNDESDGEMPKMFRVTLSLLESSFDRVNLVTDSIDITIIDDEEPPTAGEL